LAHTKNRALMHSCNS